MFLLLLVAVTNLHSPMARNTYGHMISGIETESDIPELEV